MAEIYKPSDLRFLNNIPKADEYFDNLAIKTPGNWEIVGHLSPLKLKFQNSELGIFVKIYSPNLNDYAKTAYSTLQQLSQLELKPKILAPIGIEDNALIFELAEVIDRKRFRDVYSANEISLIEKVILENKIAVLGSPEWLDICEINGQKFIIDPFDDSEYAIDPFTD